MKVQTGFRSRGYNQELRDLGGDGKGDVRESPETDI